VLVVNPLEATTGNRVAFFCVALDEAPAGTYNKRNP
jgi:hypothetical protein